MNIEIKRFDSADETRTFEKGKLDLITIAAHTLGQASYEPGWKWSEHVSPIAGTKSCNVEHVGIVISGHAKVRMDDGQELDLKASDVFAIPAGHDSWVVGNEPYVSLHLMGATHYATKED